MKQMFAALVAAAFLSAPAVAKTTHMMHAKPMSHHMMSNHMMRAHTMKAHMMKKGHMKAKHTM